MSQTHDGPDQGSPYSTPRWVKVFGIIALVLVLLVAVVLITGIGSEHGPGRHMPSSAADSDTTSTEQAVESDSPSIHTSPIEHSPQRP